MVEIRDEGIILEPTDLPFEDQAVFNPGCIAKDGLVHMFYRAVSAENISSIGYCQLKDNQVVKRLTRPLLFPEYGYERQGVEDPRIVCVEGTYYLFYTAHDKINALVAYATSPDLVHFSKQGLITPEITYDKAEDIFRQSGVGAKYRFFEKQYMQHRGRNLLLWEKDASLFPRKIKGKFALMHRVLPGIQVIYFDDFSQLTTDYWCQYLKDLRDFIILDPQLEYENRNIGGGCPPIETPHGWLLIYHAVEDRAGTRIYHAAAALLDLEDPTRFLARLPEPLFSPTAPWEKRGDVGNVVFPTGAVVEDGRLFIYYGAADTVIGAKSVELGALLAELRREARRS